MLDDLEQRNQAVLPAESRSPGWKLHVAALLKARRLCGLIGGGVLLIGVVACGGSSKSTTATAASSQIQTSVTAANYQGPLQNFHATDLANETRVAAEIATVMENNLSASYSPSRGYYIFASCQKQGLPNEFQCPWKVQNAGQVEQIGPSASGILATGIVYVYANEGGIYDAEVPAGGDSSPVGTTLPTRSISALPATATTATATNQTTTPAATPQSTMPASTTEAASPSRVPLPSSSTPDRHAYATQQSHGCTVVAEGGSWKLWTGTCAGMAEILDFFLGRSGPDCKQLSSTLIQCRYNGQIVVSATKS